MKEEGSHRPLHSPLRDASWEFDSSVIAANNASMFQINVRPRPFGTALGAINPPRFSAPTCRTPVPSNGLMSLWLGRSQVPPHIPHSTAGQAAPATSCPNRELDQEHTHREHPSREGLRRVPHQPRRSWEAIRQ